MSASIALLLLLLAGPLYAVEAPDWNAGAVSASPIALTEPAPDEVVVVINDNAFGGNHAGIFAGNLLLDPAGSYRNVRGRDKDWQEPTLGQLLDTLTRGASAAGTCQNLDASPC